MKLFIFDEKHQHVNAYLDLGELTDKEMELADHITLFLEREGITDRYKGLIMAKNYTTTYEDGEPQVEFHYE